MRKKTSFLNKSRTPMIVWLLAVMVFSNLFVVFPHNTQAAGLNKIYGGSFEKGVDNWVLWQNPNSERRYDFYRSYEPAFGYGSYSAAIKAYGAAEDAFAAGIANIDNHAFQVEAGKNYLLVINAKASSPVDTFFYLNRADNGEAIGVVEMKTVNTQWQRFLINYTPNYTGKAKLNITVGNLGDNEVLNLDGLQFLPANFSLTSSQVRAKIGSQATLGIKGIGYLEKDDIDIELPYHNAQTGANETKKFHPEKVGAGVIVFSFPTQTYSGIGSVYANDLLIGRFDYNVIPVVDEVYPVYARAGEDWAVYGSGFMPTAGNTFVIVNVVDVKGKVSKVWLEPHSMDSHLSVMYVRLPIGTVAGQMQVYTSFYSIKEVDKVNKTKARGYKVLPVINSVEWSSLGFEQVGDKVVIHGRGISNKPKVVYYDTNGKKIGTAPAKVLSIGEDEEIIEAKTGLNSTVFNVTVVSGGLESVYADAIDYAAKPKIIAIKAKHNRTMLASEEKLPAAKVGESITISGFALSSEEDVVVEFQGYERRIPVVVPEEGLNKQGRSVTVVVPEGALSGYLGVKINDQTSNYLPLEIIPTVLNISPNPAIPGESITVVANGVGDKVELTKVYLDLGDGKTHIITPERIEMYYESANIYLKTPLAVSSSFTKVNVQYDHWKDDGSAVINVVPHIETAAYNPENKVLTIRGYGFSIHPKENIITYMYADEDKTVISPTVRSLGVYPTEEGQEIRLQIQDDYHYGYVKVTVGDLTSNEAQFGPVVVQKIVRRVEYVPAEDRVMGVLYISGYNFGSEGGVQVGGHWANVHYRSNFFIIAVIDEQYLYDNPVIVARP